MWKRLSFIVCVVLAAAACANTEIARSGAKTSVPTLNKIESRTLPPEEVSRRVGAQLGEVLQFRPPEPQYGTPRNPLMGAGFFLGPGASWVEDVCTVTRIGVGFGQPNGAERTTLDPNTPRTAISLDAEEQFLMLRTPRVPTTETELEAADQTDDEWRVLDEACERTDPFSDNYVRGQHAEQVQLSYQLLELLKTLLAAPTLDVPFNCYPDHTTEDYPGDEGRPYDCQQELRGLSAAALTETRYCFSPKCIDMDFANRLANLRIHYASPLSGSGSFSPLRIKRIELYKTWLTTGVSIQD